MSTPTCNANACGSKTAGLCRAVCPVPIAIGRAKQGTAPYTPQPQTQRPGVAACNRRNVCGRKPPFSAFPSLCAGKTVTSDGTKGANNLNQGPVNRQLRLGNPPPARRPKALLNPPNRRDTSFRSAKNNTAVVIGDSTRGLHRIFDIHPLVLTTQGPPCRTTATFGQAIPTTAKETRGTEAGRPSQPSEGSQALGSVITRARASDGPTEPSIPSPSRSLLFFPNLEARRLSAQSTLLSQARNLISPCQGTFRRALSSPRNTRPTHRRRVCSGGMTHWYANKQGQARHPSTGLQQQQSEVERGRYVFRITHPSTNIS